MTLSNTVSIIQQLLKFPLKVYGHHHHHYDQYNCLFQMRQNSLLLRIVGPEERMQKTKKSITWLSSLLVYSPQSHLVTSPRNFASLMLNKGTEGHLSISLFFFFFFGRTVQHMGSYFPNQGLNPHTLQWKHRVLPTGQPGNSLKSSSWPSTQFSCYLCSYNKLGRGIKF